MFDAPNATNQPTPSRHHPTQSLARADQVFCLSLSFRLAFLPPHEISVGRGLSQGSIRLAVRRWIAWHVRVPSVLLTWLRVRLPLPPR